MVRPQNFLRFQGEFWKSASRTRSRPHWQESREQAMRWRDRTQRNGPARPPTRTDQHRHQNKRQNHSRALEPLLGSSEDWTPPKDWAHAQMSPGRCQSAIESTQDRAHLRTLSAPWCRPSRCWRLRQLSTEACHPKGRRAKSGARVRGTLTRGLDDLPPEIRHQLDMRSSWRELLSLGDPIHGRWVRLPVHLS